MTLEQPPRRIAAQINAAAALWDYGVRPAVVFGPQRLADGTPDPQAGAIDLGAVESVGEIWGDFDVEALIALDPDLLIAPTFVDEALWYVPAEAEAVLEQRLPSVGIRATELPIVDLIERFAELAEALGADMTSPEIVAAKQEYEDAIADLRTAIAENAGLTVMFVPGGPDGLYIANPSFMTDLMHYRDLGMEIVQHDVDDFWEVLSWEDAGKHAADLILVDARTGNMTPEELNGFATWAVLPAVAAGQVTLWNPEPIYSYEGYAGVLREMAQIIRGARPDVV